MSGQTSEAAEERLEGRLTAAFDAGRPAFGAWLTVPSLPVVEIAGEVGWDYVCLDMQHGLFDYADVRDALIVLRASSSDVLVRIPSIDAGLIGKILDAGAHGLVAPMVESAAQAAALVDACRYAPLGSRSYGPIRAGRRFSTRRPQALGSVLCIPMIESPQAIAAIPEIAQVDGISALYLGPADLALSIGLPPSLHRPEPEHGEAMLAALEASKRAGVPLGIQCSSPASGLKAIDQGYDYATVWKDSQALLDSVRESYGAVSTDGEPSGPTGYM